MVFGESTWLLPKVVYYELLWISVNSLPLGLLEGIRGHVPQGYLFARQTVLLPKFPTGDLTAIDGRGPT